MVVEFDRLVKAYLLENNLLNEDGTGQTLIAQAMLEMPESLRGTLAEVAGPFNFNSINETFNSTLTAHVSKRIFSPKMYDAHVKCAVLEFNQAQRPNDPILQTWYSEIMEKFLVELEAEASAKKQLEMNE